MPRRTRVKAITGLATVLVATTAASAWWFAVGVNLDHWRIGPPPHPWASLVRQEQRWRSEGLARRVHHEYVSLEAVSVELLLALVVSEDARFLDHGPVDGGALRDAVRDWWAGGRLRGASTISQQLARTLFLSQERTVLRKLRELKLAWWLERELGKRRVVELYLNVVEFGPGVFGAEAAARRYFGVPAACLDPRQAAALAAAVPAPGVDNPATASERWKWRRQRIATRALHASQLRLRLATLAGHSRPCSPEVQVR